MSVPIIWSVVPYHTFFFGRALFAAQPLSTLAQPGSGFSEVPPLVCEHPQLQISSLDYESGRTNFYSLLPSKEHVLSIRVSKRYSTIFIGVPAITEYLKGKQKELPAEPARRMGRGKSLSSPYSSSVGWQLRRQITPNSPTEPARRLIALKSVNKLYWCSADKFTSTQDSP